MTSRALFPPPIGWPLLPVPDDSGSLGFPSLERSVREQIRVILLTKLGAQLLRPDFGAGLEEFVYGSNTSETRRQARSRIRESLRTWEPRIELDRVEVYEVPASPADVRVEICYRIRRTGNAQQINLTVEVQG